MSTIKRHVTIVNVLGLHARASAKFVATASRFQSHIEVNNGRQTINGKSIMGVMMLAATQNTILEINIHGPDAEAMAQALSTLIENKFGEAE